MQVNVTFARVTTLIGILIIILGGMFALGRYIRTDRIEELEHEVATLKESKDWKLPETLESLNQVSDKVRSQIEEMQKVEALRKENEALQSDNAKLTEQVETLAKQNASLEAEVKQNIASMDTFERSEGGSVSLINNSVRMGLTTIWADHVDFNLKNESQSLEIGNSTSFTYADQKCTITLVEIKYFADPETAKFSFGCT